jgi:tetraacyldisaccharide 4'-kinase
VKAPSFWWREPGLASALLSPVSAIWGLVAGRRMARDTERCAVPVICVGNVTVGGSGKTPTSLKLASILAADGRCPAFLTRGYGGSLTGPVLVDPARHTSAEVGDEALLLARAAPTIVARDRPAGAALAAETGADVIVMDDGLQNPSLAKDVSIAVFDGAVGLGNGRVLPAGPLRAPLAMQWPRIDAVLIVGTGRPGDAVAAEAAARGLPVLRAHLEPAANAADALAGRRVLAFAGIGRPEKFFETCRALGAELVVTRAFPDHHPYEVREMSVLLDEAEAKALVPVTTEKDAVRLERLRGLEPRLGLVRLVPIEMVFEDEPALRALLGSLFLQR